MSNALKNLSILNTRQAQYSKTLDSLITANMGTVISLPLLDVTSLLDTATLRHIIHDLSACDLCVLVSRNSAELLLPHLAPELIRSVTWACVGPATSKCLSEYGVSNCIYPRIAPYNSISLISELHSRGIILNQANVMILTGESGDMELNATMSQQGAIIHLTPVYRRIRPHISKEQVSRVFNSIPGVDIILITCVTSLVHLQQLAQEMQLAILDIPLLVVSPRIARAALEMGHINVYTTESMSEADILSGLIQWRENING